MPDPSWYYCFKDQVSWRGTDQCWICGLEGLLTYHNAYGFNEGYRNTGDCWGDIPHKLLDNETQACDQPGTGRLGLCPEHEAELLPPVCHVSDVLLAG